jgi:hypothetical protein
LCDVEDASAQHRDPMHERGIHAICYSELPVGFAEGIERDRKTA